MNLFLKDGASFGSVNEAGQPAFCHVFSFLRVSCLSLADSNVARPDIPRKQSGCADKRSCSFKIRRDSATCKLARDTAVKLSSFYIKRNFCKEYRTGTISATAFLIRWLDHAWSLEIKTDLAGSRVTQKYSCVSHIPYLFRGCMFSEQKGKRNL